MKALTALWLMLRGFSHVVGGWWTIRTRFPHMTQAQREARVQQWAARFLHIWRIGLDVRGTPPKQGPVLMVVNHISWLDILVMHAAGYCRFVSKADVKDWPVIGPMATGAGTLYKCVGADGVPKLLDLGIAIHAKEILSLRAKLNEIMSHHTGQPIERIARDTDRDNFLSAQEAAEYGLIDKVLADRSAV